MGYKLPGGAAPGLGRSNMRTTSASSKAWTESVVLQAGCAHLTMLLEAVSMWELVKKEFVCLLTNRETYNS